MKNILLIAGLLIFTCHTGSAQVASVLIGVNGLTCSQCTRHVEMQLRRLPFVSGVRMNLQHTNGVVELKEGVNLEPERIVRSVEDAGFSIRYLKVVVAHPERYRAGSSCLLLPRLGLQVVGELPPTLPDLLYLQLLGKPFQPRKEVRPFPKRACTGSRYFVMLSLEDQS